MCMCDSVWVDRVQDYLQGHSNKIVSHFIRKCEACGWAVHYSILSLYVLEELVTLMIHMEALFR